MTEPDALDPIVRAALLADELQPGPTEGQRQRMAARMAAAIGTSAAALTGPAAPTPATPTPATPTGTAAPVSAKAALAIGLVIGGIGGAVITRWLAHRAPPSLAVSRDAGTSAPPAPVVVDAAASPDATAPPDAPDAVDGGLTRAPVQPRDRAPTPPPLPTADPVARERALLDAARAALRAGDLTLARRNLAEHGLRYPEGALREEREVLAIEELVARGQRDAARGRAAAFHASFPGSIHAARVDALVAP